MTGREKIEAAFSPEGTPEFAAVIPYEGIYIRDHWDELTSLPWWYAFETDLERQLAWRREVIRRTGQDWCSMSPFPPRETRETTSIVQEDGEVYQVDRRSGSRRLLVRPSVGGMAAPGEILSPHPARLPEVPEELDGLLPIPSPFEAEAFSRSGRGDLADALLREFGHELFPISCVSSPLWSCYGLWGFEGMMTMTLDRPDLVRYACNRFLKSAERDVHRAAALGVAGIWIEDCMTDMVSPADFESLNVHFLRRLADVIRSLGLRSIHYFCGNPAGKWDPLLSTGVDALSLEEGKKGFTIDIAEVVDRVNGQCAVLGNLDALGLLDHGSDMELRDEIARQLEAGRRNRGRFVMSLGSPVTPGTRVGRVRRYIDLAHELGTDR